MRERLFTPLGLSHTITLPEEALLFRAAVGHLSPGGGEPTSAPVWGCRARSVPPVWSARRPRTSWRSPGCT